MFENLIKVILESKTLRIQGSRNPSKKDSELFEILKKAESRIQGSKDPVIQESKKKKTVNCLKIL